VHGPLPFPRLAIALALTAVVIGRGLSQALPGAVSGIGEAIDRIQLSGAVVTQLTAALLAALAMRTAAVLLFTQFDRPLLSMVSTITTAMACLATLYSALLTHNQLAPQWSGLLAVCVGATLLWSATIVLGRARLRAVGLIAVDAASASLIHTFARVVALLTAEQASVVGFEAARGIATLGFALEIACIAAALTWLLARTAMGTRGAAALALLTAPAIGLATSRSETWAVITGRTLWQLSAHPDPMLPAMLKHSGELWGLIAVILCILIRTRSVALMFIVAMCLLGRASADIPVGALFLLNAALALQLPHPQDLANEDSNTPPEQNRTYV